MRTSVFAQVVASLNSLVVQVKTKSMHMCIACMSVSMSIHTVNGQSEISGYKRENVWVHVSTHVFACVCRSNFLGSPYNRASIIVVSASVGVCVIGVCQIMSKTFLIQCHLANKKFETFIFVALALFH